MKSSKGDQSEFSLSYQIIPAPDSYLLDSEFSISSEGSVYLYHPISNPQIKRIEIFVDSDEFFIYFSYKDRYPCENNFESFENYLNSQIDASYHIKNAFDGIAPLAYPDESPCVKENSSFRFCLNYCEVLNGESLYIHVKNLKPGNVKVKVNELKEDDMLSEDLKLMKSKFDDVFLDDPGHELSLQTRKLDKVMNRPEFTYGEIEFIPMVPVFRSLQISPNSVFWDLGCGTGKLLLSMHLLFPDLQIKGVEYLESLYLQCISNLSKIPTNQITVIHGDLQEVDWSDADIIYCANLCFPASLNESLKQKCLKLKPKTILILLQSLSIPKFDLLNQYDVEMTWGNATVYIYQNSNSY